MISFQYIQCTDDGHLSIWSVYIYIVIKYKSLLAPRSASGYLWSWYGQETVAGQAGCLKLGDLHPSPANLALSTNLSAIKPAVKSSGISQSWWKPGTGSPDPELSAGGVSWYYSTWELLQSSYSLGSAWGVSENQMILVDPNIIYNDWLARLVRKTRLIIICWQAIHDDPSIYACIISGLQRLSLDPPKSALVRWHMHLLKRTRGTTGNMLLGKLPS